MKFRRLPLLLFFLFMYICPHSLNLSLPLLLQIEIFFNLSEFESKSKFESKYYLIYLNYSHCFLLFSFVCKQQIRKANRVKATQTYERIDKTKGREVNYSCEKKTTSRTRRRQ